MIALLCGDREGLAGVPWVRLRAVRPAGGLLRAHYLSTSSHLSPKDAERAVAELQGKTLGSRAIQITYADRRMAEKERKKETDKKDKTGAKKKKPAAGDAEDEDEDRDDAEPGEESEDAEGSESESEGEDDAPKQRRTDKKAAPAQDGLTKNKPKSERNNSADVDGRTLVVTGWYVKNTMKNAVDAFRRDGKLKHMCALVLISVSCQCGGDHLSRARQIRHDRLCRLQDPQGMVDSSCTCCISFRG